MSSIYRNIDCMQKTGNCDLNIGNKSKQQKLPLNDPTC